MSSGLKIIFITGQIFFSFMTIMSVMVAYELNIKALWLLPVLFLFFYIISHLAYIKYQSVELENRSLVFYDRKRKVKKRINIDEIDKYEITRKGNNRLKIVINHNHEVFKIDNFDNPNFNQIIDLLNKPTPQ